MDWNSVARVNIAGLVRLGLTSRKVRVWLIARVLEVGARPGRAQGPAEPPMIGRLQVARAAPVSG